MLAVMYFDVRSYLIPNWLNAALLAVFPVWMLVVHPHPDWLSSLFMFGALLGVGFALFCLRVMGGGDVKLLAVLGLYTGWTSTGLGLLVYMAMLGGVFSILLLFARACMPWIALRLGLGGIPRLLTMGQPIPYGLAIAGAFLLLIWTNRLLPVIG